MNYSIIKKNRILTPDPRLPISDFRTPSPKVSIILLDWSCREKFFALDWLNNQKVDRDKYELIWVELYRGVNKDVIDKVDTVIECNQKGIYHKHKGYNLGLLHSSGEIITVCDSDAVFSPGFIPSIIKSFDEADDNNDNLVLMHHEFRTASEYPDKGIEDINRLRDYTWEPLSPNVGACVSVKKTDAIRFGGFDEHGSYKGFICGPYELVWRLINAGLNEVWYDEDKVALWHFSHPNPTGQRGEKFSWKIFKEILCSLLHIKFHAFTAVKAFLRGRLEPIKENKDIHKLRMGSRRIGSEFEKEFSSIKHLYIRLVWELFICFLKFCRVMCQRIYRIIRMGKG